MAIITLPIPPHVLKSESFDSWRIKFNEIIDVLNSISGTINAEDIVFDNAGTSLVGADVQAVIEELDDKTQPATAIAHGIARPTNIFDIITLLTTSGAAPSDVFLSLDDFKALMLGTQTDVPFDGPGFGQLPGTQDYYLDTSKYAQFSGGLELRWGIATIPASVSNYQVPFENFVVNTEIKQFGQTENQNVTNGQTVITLQEMFVEEGVNEVTIVFVDTTTLTPVTMYKDRDFEITGEAELTLIGPYTAGFPDSGTIAVTRANLIVLSGPTHMQLTPLINANNAAGSLYLRKYDIFSFYVENTFPYDVECLWYAIGGQGAPSLGTTEYYHPAIGDDSIFPTTAMNALNYVRMRYYQDGLSGGYTEHVVGKSLQIDGQHKLRLKYNGVGIRENESTAIAGVNPLVSMPTITSLSGTTNDVYYDDGVVSPYRLNEGSDYEIVSSTDIQFTGTYAGTIDVYTYWVEFLPGGIVDTEVIAVLAADTFVTTTTLIFEDSNVLVVTYDDGIPVELVENVDYTKDELTQTITLTAAAFGATGQFPNNGNVTVEQRAGDNGAGVVELLFGKEKQQEYDVTSGQTAITVYAYPLAPEPYNMSYGLTDIIEFTYYDRADNGAAIKFVEGVDFQRELTGDTLTLIGAYSGGFPSNGKANIKIIRIE
ncbi:MAG: hypothetical protein BV459_00270 [Thermoplasmata archaeon M11B2D]|nr:MAG: hypothetical protein BV459_00270 [Thermoplasmata archaeon M11B2D]